LNSQRTAQNQPSTRKMLVLFDNGTPRTLARYLIDHHAVTEARARGWEELENGELLTEAEAAGFEVLVTTDKISVISRTLQPAG
jgi:nitric oxide reductase activation protein